MSCLIMILFVGVILLITQALWTRMKSHIIDISNFKEHILSALFIAHVIACYIV